jgi:predicted DNA binding CopG/RHH family protein
MSGRIKYRDGPVGDVEVIEDFLPAPEDLVFEDETVKVTIALSKASVDFFKQEADQRHTSYQKMIRRLLDTYAKRHRSKSERTPTRAR